MNATERKYADRLERLKLEGKIAKYEFECDRLPLGDDCTYSPDFTVEQFDGFREYHEVKSMWTERKVGWREDAKIKFKWARQRYYVHVLVLAALHKDGSWHLEEYNGESATITPEERAAGRSGVHALAARCGRLSTRRGASTRRRSE